MRPFLPLILILAVSITVVAPSLCPQADYVGFSLDYMMTHADFIVVGNVYGAVENDTFATYHLVRFAVERYYKGDGPQLIEIRLEGGPGMWTEDQPNLVVGASYLLFLRANNGFIEVYSGLGGAARIEGGVASNGQYAIRVTDSGFVKVPGSHVTPTGFRNNTDLIAHDLAWLVITYDNAGPTPGYWTFHVRFEGMSDEANGVVEYSEPSGFLLFPKEGVFAFYHNFTASGRYRVSIDGKELCDIDVDVPHTQVPIVGISTTAKLLSDKEITVKANAGKSTVTGELKTTLVVMPPSGTSVYYSNYTKCYEGYPNEFDFRVVFPEGGDYALTVWQNGVKQLSTTVTVQQAINLGGPPQLVILDKSNATPGTSVPVQPPQDSFLWLAAFLTLAGLLLLGLKKGS